MRHPTPLPPAGTLLRRLTSTFPLALLLCAACAPSDSVARVRADRPVIIEKGDPEARGWLARNGSPAALASNRFDTTTMALAFVDSLYAAGAARVVVDGESIRDDESELALGGPYADALKVELPADPERRRAVLRLTNREAAGQGFARAEDRGQRVVLLWWD
ncbi:MAG TPA: hypothetical protein VFS05_11510 [Gemmatimonadaceae bacterium]|nr:hypothetical protein [Gemmatimonadaceae bacterium]